MVRILLKFAGTNEVIGSLTLERDPSVVGGEPRELAFMGYSGQALYQPTERDEDVVLHISGFNKVSYSDGNETVDVLNDEREESLRTKEDARQAAENTDPPVHPSALPPVAAENGERMIQTDRERVPDSQGDFRLVEDEGETHVALDENLQSDDPNKPEVPAQTGNVPSPEGAELGQELAPRAGTTLTEDRVEPDLVPGTPPAGGKVVSQNSTSEKGTKK